MKTLHLIPTAVAVLALCGCKSNSDSATNPTNASRGLPAVLAMATLSPASGSEVKGVVTFFRDGNDIRVEASLSGLTPGLHGFHIHEKGDCSAPDASSAGGHFNPTHMAHGAPGTANRHVGDFGNIEADASGNARYSRTFADLKVEGETSILDRAIIVHAKADDLKTQPTGDAGGRVACGVITKPN